MKTQNIFFITIALVAGISGCAQKDKLVHGQYETPSEISYAWDDGKDTYVLPKKGVALSPTVFTEFSQLKLLESGSYFYVPGIHKKLVLSDQSGKPIVLVQSK